MTDQQNFKRSIEILKSLRKESMSSLNAEAIKLGVGIKEPIESTHEFLERLWRAISRRHDYDRAVASLALQASLTGRQTEALPLKRHIQAAMADIKREDVRTDEEFMGLLSTL